jgi:hypothetical protein
MTEQELLLECVRRLNSCGLKYMLTGSMASNAWGIPRTTHDLDFVIQKLYWNSITPSDRQLSDVAGVVHVQRGRLDEAYLRRWAAELRVTAELEAALSGALKPKRT